MFAPYEKIKGMINWLVGVKIIKRAESLIIEDRRPTWPMLVSVLGAVFFSLVFIFSFFGYNFFIDSLGIWMVGIPGVVCVGLSFRGTIREQYIFDRPSDTYQFARQFLYKKEVIEGTISQFCGVGVQTVTHDDWEKHSVILRSEGIFLGLAPVQEIRATKPAFNFWNTEDCIAQAIHKFLNIPRIDAE